jgi:hypothetical protein
MLGGMLEPMLKGMLEKLEEPFLVPPFPTPLGVLLFVSYPATTSTVSVLAVLVPLPFGRPTFKVPLARFASNSAIRN